MQNIYNKKVEIILLIPQNEKVSENNISVFYDLINEYNSIEEPDLDLNLILNDRKHQNERQYNFD